MSGTEDKHFWMLIRQALLLMVDAIERKWRIDPRTSQLRRIAKG